MLHFILIGAAIYLLYGVFAEPAMEETDKNIVVSAGEIEWMQSSWQQRWNRPPTAKELDGLIQEYIKETVLYRQALTMGLNQHDQIIRRRLAQKLEFLAKDLVRLTPPTEQELQAYFDKHRQRYAQPLSYTFIQVFFNPDKRGDATHDDAEAVKTTLIEQGNAINDPGALGDQLMLKNFYSQKDQNEIQKQFGSDFAKTLSTLSPRQWHGPILSGFGVHLVYLSSVSEPPAPTFAQTHERVMQDWKFDKSEELNQQFYSSLREQYTIVIQQPGQDDQVATMQDQDKGQVK
jgi:peptidyl-prolyl cis-trans isomerase C